MDSVYHLEGLTVMQETEALEGTMCVLRSGCGRVVYILVCPACQMPGLRNAGALPRPQEDCPDCAY